MRGFAASIRYLLEYSSVKYKLKEYDRLRVDDAYSYPLSFEDEQSKLQDPLEIHKYIANRWKPKLMRPDI